MEVGRLRGRLIRELREGSKERKKLRKGKGTQKRRG
jgi:hypothetical protein